MNKSARVFMFCCCYFYKQVQSPKRSFSLLFIKRLSFPLSLSLALTRFCFQQQQAAASLLAANNFILSRDVTHTHKIKRRAQETVFRRPSLGTSRRTGRVVFVFVLV